MKKHEECSKKLKLPLIVCLMVSIFLPMPATAVSPKVAAGLGYTIVLKSNGTLDAAGLNDSGQLGIGSTEQNKVHFYPVGTETNWASIAAGDHHALALKSDGTLWSWGSNNYGQLGDGTTTNNSTTPIQIGTDANWVSVAAGNYHSLALKSDGTLWAWGYNSNGQLGDGKQVFRSTVPIQVGADTDWQSISAGVYFTVALKSNGTLWTWGYNVYGELGNGSTAQNTVPMQIGSDTNWRSIAAGDYHTLALKSDGTLWAWGYNVFGQVGITPNSYAPNQIGTDSNWASISAGTHHSAAVKSDGTLWTWGYGGMLGDGTTINSLVPVQIGSADWGYIEAGSYHTTAIKRDGTLWSWGSNSYGQLGNWNTTYSLVPLVIMSTTNLSDADADGWYSYQDCNESNFNIHPEGIEIIYNGIDENCNGMADDDDLDHDGYEIASDCDDNDASIHPYAQEIKLDGIDQDCNDYDLTINITTATYDARKKSLTVEATSSLNAKANLRLADFGPMTWKRTKWTITVSTTINPGTVVVDGIEGYTASSVTVK